MNRCIFPECVSTDRHWHGGFPGGYDNPEDPEGPPIEFTAEPTPGVRDYNGALLRNDAWFSPWHLGQISEVFLTPAQLEVMAARIRAHFGQPPERP